MCSKEFKSKSACTYSSLLYGIPAKLQLCIYSANYYFGDDSFLQLIEMTKTRRHAYIPTRHCHKSRQIKHRSLSKFRFPFLRTIFKAFVTCHSQFQTPLYNVPQLGIFSNVSLWEPINILKVEHFIGADFHSSSLLLLSTKYFSVSTLNVFL